MTVFVLGTVFASCPHLMELAAGEAVGQERCQHFMTEHNTERRIERTTTEARAGVTDHNVRYLLAASLLGVIIAFAGLWYFWAA